ncbi:hypothetical protein TD95_002623 [Thielaviopsis punctulata]|uniref:beta-glucosidase n=1 Tax=Thielaviopsis punctulata TaxID=72032 RepID=A0A0F4ZK52_9PEZI|nr:hypothetical protein TD95_002623 [Thielaviopsis punctulata]
MKLSLLTIVVSAAFGSAHVIDEWTKASQAADIDLVRLTTAEKVGLVTGLSWGNGTCMANTGDAISIGYRSLCLQEGSSSIMNNEGATKFPSGIHLAASWDRSLMKSHGIALGKESRELGINVFLGPAAGALGKIPAGGRN